MKVDVEVVLQSAKHADSWGTEVHFPERKFDEAENVEDLHGEGKYAEHVGEDEQKTSSRSDFYWQAAKVVYRLEIRCGKAREVSRLRDLHENLLQESQADFLKALGLQATDELHFFSPEEDLGSTASQDWQRLRSTLERALQYDRVELAAVRKTLLLHYRALRDAFKLYSGMGHDSHCALSFAEFMCLLQDAQICEPQDADLVQRMLLPMLTAGGPDVAKPSLPSAGARLLHIGDMQLTRVQFLEALTRVLLSEDLHKLHNARHGRITELDALTRGPAHRLDELINKSVAPFLEQRTHSRAVRRALESEHVLRIFVQYHASLHRVYNKYTGMRGVRRASSRRASSKRRSSASSLLRTTSRQGQPMDLTTFLMVLQEANIVIDEHAQSAAPVKRSQGAHASDRYTLEVADDLERTLRGFEHTKLTFADARGLFAASQLENEDEDAASVYSDHDSVSILASLSGRTSGREGQDMDEASNDDEIANELLGRHGTTRSMNSMNIRSTLEDLSYKEFIEVLVRVAFALTIVGQDVSSTDRIRAVVQRLASLLGRRRESDVENR
ncbi:Hypothetical Protein FCC1311_105732 [Hondaea fermentalgiana]|uniref:Uncharacterized protein n=1 Tax=Hondaea fermentalgiana TaxID=2315210 RepID=A0A2R5GU23_9STRA|nr:Hypothetical Protein FCC1311_105732 [Hondaea fermentalgiana]|eukprot:GBG34350.1 Hypothetical Protein FCC1311_105732 [Hondaea fermentalgiana]